MIGRTDHHYDGAGPLASGAPIGAGTAVVATDNRLQPPSVALYLDYAEYLLRMLIVRVAALEVKDMGRLHLRYWTDVLRLW